METKRCSSCKRDKGPEEFYKNRSKKSGLHSMCQACMLAYRKTSRQTVASRAIDKATQKKYWQSKVGRAVRKRYNQLNREKKKAHNAVYYALKTSKLTRPSICESCQKECKPNGHHEDYSKLLDVEWLCDECHRKLRDKV